MMHTAKLLLSNTVLAVCFFCLLACFKINKNAPAEMTKIQVTSWFEIGDTTGGVNTFKDTLYIYYKDKYVLYELPYRQIYLKENKSDMGNREFDYFVHTNGAVSGWRFRSLTDMNKGRKANVDSLVKKAAFAGSATRSLVDEYTLLNVKDDNAADDTFIKKYYMSLPEDDNYPDTVLLYFSNRLKNIDYPLSRDMDSLTNSKLYRLKAIYRQRYYSEYKKLMPARVIEIKFEKIDSIENRDAINKVFDAFEKLKL
jgi:hypothetical protein